MKLKGKFMITEQSPRPWAPRTLRLRPARPEQVVAVVGITPEADDHSPLRSLRVNAKAVRAAVASDLVLAVGWSRTTVELIVEAAADDSDDAIRDTALARIDKVVDVSTVTITVEVDPSGWDCALRSVERAARYFARGQHQCRVALDPTFDGRTGACWCGLLGNEFPTTTANSRGELGFLLALGGEYR